MPQRKVRAIYMKKVVVPDLRGSGFVEVFVFLFLFSFAFAVSGCEPYQREELTLPFNMCCPSSSLALGPKLGCFGPCGIQPVVVIVILVFFVTVCSCC